MKRTRNEQKSLKYKRRDEIEKENKRLTSENKALKAEIKTLQDKFTNAKAYLDEKLDEINKG